MELVKASPDELQQMKDKEVEPLEEIEEKKTTIQKYISKFEIFILIRAVYITNDNIFKTFCSCIGAFEMRSVFLLNKRCHERLLKYNGDVFLTIPLFTRFLTSRMALDKAGFMSGMHVSIINSEIAPPVMDVHDIDVLSEYLACSKEILQSRVFI